MRPKTIGNIDRKTILFPRRSEVAYGILATDVEEIQTSTRVRKRKLGIWSTRPCYVHEYFVSNWRPLLTANPFETAQRVEHSLAVVVRASIGFLRLYLIRRKGSLFC